MRVALAGALLALFWFALSNLLSSAVAWLAARALLLGRPQSAGLLLAVRLLPLTLSTAFVLGVFLPSHYLFEPAESDESFGLVMGSAALLACAILLRSVWRAGRILLTDRRLAALTQRDAMPLTAGVYEVHDLPGVSLAGILRPKILVGSAAVAALTPGELDVAISHEIAHQRSRDNLKRFLVHCAPDMFGLTATARRLEEAWQAEAECSADAQAARGDAGRAVVLASALVKVARLSRRSGMVVPSPAWSAFHVPTLLETRVRRLVHGRLSTPLRIDLLSRGLLALALGGPAAVWLMDASYAFHLVTEFLVASLP